VDLFRQQFIAKQTDYINRDRAEQWTYCKPFISISETISRNIKKEALEILQILNFSSVPALSKNVQPDAVHKTAIFKSNVCFFLNLKVFISFC
jgi:hypothetical protein